MKSRPKSFTQVVNETWPDKQINAAKADDYISLIQQELAVYLPLEWQNKINAKKYQNGILYIELISAAYKMRFNAVRLDLLSHLRKKIPDLVSINEQINPNKNLAPAQIKVSAQRNNNKTELKNNLSAKAQTSILDAAKNLPDNLRFALERLAKSKK
ncbi:hypothetical protein [Algibacillus agarilyticus]|uniref:hypothetical protein n=1 Tax=Algibacillus agarilyticus TaxID=2234133 RepID=UPI000DCFD3CD|nr:hypothetical protein [Algibacillus agarilyticus]